jgi:hypothetical protein
MIQPGSKQPNVRRMRLARCRYSSLTAAEVGHLQSAAGNSRPAGIGVPGGALCASRIKSIRPVKNQVEARHEVGTGTQLWAVR